MRISDWSSDVCSSDLGRRGEAVAADAEDGKPARTLYQVVQSHGKAATWLVLLPLTGRTHQLRVHCAALGTPIVGEGKYGGRSSAERRAGKECVSTCRYRGSRYLYKKTHTLYNI